MRAASGGTLGWFGALYAAPRSLRRRLASNLDGRSGRTRRFPRRVRVAGVRRDGPQVTVAGFIPQCPFSHTPRFLVAKSLIPGRKSGEYRTLFHLFFAFLQGAIHG